MLAYGFGSSQRAAFALSYFCYSMLNKNLRPVFVCYNPRAKFRLELLVCCPFLFCHMLHLPTNLRC